MISWNVLIKSCTEGDQLSALWIDSSCERHWDLVTIHRHDFQKKIQAQRQSENLLLYPEIEPVPARPGSWRWLSSWGSGTHSGGHRDSGDSRGHRGVLRKLPADSSLWPAAPRELPGLLRHWLTHIMSHPPLLIRSTSQDMANMSLIFTSSFRNCFS